MTRSAMPRLDRVDPLKTAIEARTAPFEVSGPDIPPDPETCASGPEIQRMGHSGVSSSVIERDMRFVCRIVFWSLVGAGVLGVLVAAGVLS